MRHPTEGTLRRLVDEPAGVADADRSHVAGCPRCRAALAAAGEDAGPVLAEGRRWVEQTVAQVPDSFRESFLERHPTQRALRA